MLQRLQAKWCEARHARHGIFCHGWPLPWQSSRNSLWPSWGMPRCSLNFLGASYAWRRLKWHGITWCIRKNSMSTSAWGQEYDYIKRERRKLIWRWKPMSPWAVLSFWKIAAIKGTLIFWATKTVSRTRTGHPGRCEFVVLIICGSAEKLVTQKQIRAKLLNFRGCGRRWVRCCITTIWWTCISFFLFKSTFVPLQHTY